MKGLKHHKNVGFQRNTIHTMREPHALFYLKKRMSFWIASLSLFTFLIGNMMGQHGWYGFWASVLGQEDLSAIAYVGTVTPIEKVVDYSCWTQYGGDFKVHTFRQAPEKCLRRMPEYTSGADHDPLYSMQYMSSYELTTEGSGQHGGIDIRVPVGTPIRATMTGRVEKIGEQPRGFGTYVVLLHPNVPEPDRPTRSTTTLYTNYAHLSAVYVEEGDIVHKGDVIALSGNTGYSTGPHLDFSVVREDVPYIPYYPESQTDGYAYTVNPMMYVQNNFIPVTDQSTIVADSQRRSRDADQPGDVVAPRRIDVAQAEPVVATPEPESTKTIIARLQARRDERLKERLAQRDSRQVVALQTGLTNVLPEQPAAPKPEVASEQTVTETVAGRVDTVSISHDGSFTGRGWEKVIVTLLDADGNIVTSPRLNNDIALRTDFGEAEFRPSILSPLDFVRGQATVHVLPRGRRTVVIKVMPYNVISAPLEYDR